MAVTCSVFSGSGSREKASAISHWLLKWKGSFDTKGCHHPSPRDMRMRGLSSLSSVSRLMLRRHVLGPFSPMNVVRRCVAGVTDYKVVCVLLEVADGFSDLLSDSVRCSPAVDLEYRPSVLANSVSKSFVHISPAVALSVLPEASKLSE